MVCPYNIESNNGKLAAYSYDEKFADDYEISSTLYKETKIIAQTKDKLDLEE